MVITLLMRLSTTIWLPCHIKEAEQSIQVSNYKILSGRLFLSNVVRLSKSRPCLKGVNVMKRSQYVDAPLIPRISFRAIQV
jgi:hypothetical protein